MAFINVWRIARSVFWYANEGKYVNERPHLDVNYSVPLITISLMRHKAKEQKWKGCHKMIYVQWWENVCVCFVLFMRETEIGVLFRDVCVHQCNTSWPTGPRGDFWSALLKMCWIKNCMHPLTHTCKQTHTHSLIPILSLMLTIIQTVVWHYKLTSALYFTVH